MKDEHRGTVGGTCKIFYVRYENRNGFVYENLEESLEKTALLLFLASPASCRRVAWCRYELQHFLDRARPIAYPGLAGENRIFKLLLRSVHGGIPYPLDNVPSVDSSQPSLATPFLLS